MALEIILLINRPLHDFISYRANLKKGQSRIFYRPSKDFDAVAIVGLGNEDAGYNEAEDINEKKELIRSAVAAGCKSLQTLEVNDICIEDLGDAEACAEGATLSLWSYDEFKTTKKSKQPNIHCFQCSDKEKWKEGLIQGNAQNLVRKLADTPANHMTPQIFAKVAEKELSSEGVEVVAHDKSWAENKKMGSFLCVAKGSDEPPVFLEMKYMNGGDSKPLVLVGKGVTFDSGGISIKPSGKMDEMRADMTGAAVVVGAMKAVAQLKLPINLIGLTPLCENLLNGKAVKPGDIVTAMNGKTIQVDNTDAEGRLILADALCYASSFDPSVTIDIATLTGAMRVAIGDVLTGVFSTSEDLYEELREAGIYTGDRVWRFPLFSEYSKRMTDWPNVDVNNVGKGAGGGACTAAAFLKEFSPKSNWMHLDIAGVMGPDLTPALSYLSKGMTGRPTRTIIQYIKQKTNCSNEE